MIASIVNTKLLLFLLYTQFRANAVQPNGMQQSTAVTVVEPYLEVTYSGGMWPESPNNRKVTRPLGCTLNHVTDA